MPSIDLTYVEDKYSGLSTQAWLNVWSTLKGRKVGPSKGHSLNDTKVNIPSLIMSLRVCCMVTVTKQLLRIMQMDNADGVALIWSIF